MSAAAGNADERRSELSVGDLKPEARTLSSAEFEERHGSGFLLVAAPHVQPHQGPRATVISGLGAAPAAGEATAGVAQIIHPLRRGVHSVAPFVAVGRTPNNDVVITDVTVSRFHAFFKHDRDAGWRVQDAGSKNGTRLNGKPVPPQGQGEAPALHAGDDLRIGSVELTFLDAKALHAYLLAFD